MNNRALAPSTLARTALFASLFAYPVAASAQEYFDPNPFLPSPWYLSTQSANFEGGISVRLPAVQVLGGQMPPPAQGMFSESFFDVFASIEINGLPAVQAPGTAGARFFSQQNPGPPTLIDTEILSLDLSGGGLPGGMMLRESPTRTSMGRASLRPVPGGFMVSSFFDVFFELSPDGGQNWLPAVQSVRIQGASAVPEPASFAVLGLGLAALIRRRRR